MKKEHSKSEKKRMEVQKPAKKHEDKMKKDHKKKK